MTSEEEQKGKQQAFLDTTVPLMLKQGEPAKNGSSCLFRLDRPGLAPLRCLVGIHPEFAAWFDQDGGSFVSLGDAIDAGFNFDSMGGEEFLDVAQGCHDNADEPDFNRSFLQRVEKLCQDYGLVYRTGWKA